jgi:hypothetical protein
VEEMGWPMRVLTIELEDGQQWGRTTAEKLSIPVLCPCQEHNCDLFEYVSLERLSIPVLVHINGSSNNTILGVDHGLNLVLISPERKSIHELFCYFWKLAYLRLCPLLWRFFKSWTRVCNWWLVTSFPAKETT